MNSIQPDSKKKKSEVPKKPMNKWDIRPYLPVIWAVLLVIVIGLAIFFIFLRFEGVASAWKTVVSSLQAIFIGLFIGYLLNPIMKFFEHRIGPFVESHSKEFTTKKKKRVRAISTAIAMVIFLVVICLLLMIIIPHIISCIQDIIGSVSGKETAAQHMLENLAKTRPKIAAYIETGMEKAVAYAENWITSKFNFGDSSSIVTLSKGVMKIVKIFFNIILGLMASIYILMRKEHFIAQVKKLVYGIFKPVQANVAMELLHKADDIFGGFLIGDIIDSVIIGFICLGAMLILRMPYACLIALIVGVTNLIPIYGPYMGAIPGVALLFLADPKKALFFIILIIVIQQFDGNILKPRILGDTLGLSPFWILFAIVLFGGCFGVVGMFFGVPIFAMIYYIVKRIIEHVLRVRKLPTDTEKFINLDHVDTKTNQPVDHEQAGRRTRHYWYHKNDARRNWFRGRF